MRRLTRSEIEHHWNAVTRWQTPADLLSYVQAIGDHMGSSDLFNQAGIEFYRDGWTAAKVGIAMKARAVRLIQGGADDCEIDFGDRKECWQIVEADLPGRERGTEYRGPASVEDDPVEDWQARADQVPEALRLAIHRKVSKKYAGRPWLLIHLNIDEWGIRQREITRGMAEWTREGRAAFSRIAILWKGRTYEVWRDEQAAA